MAAPMSDPVWKVDLQEPDAGDGLGFDSLDAVDGGRVTPFTEEHHPPFHVFRREPGVIPHHHHHRDADGRKDIDHHPAHRKDAERHDE